MKTVLSELLGPGFWTSVWCHVISYSISSWLPLFVFNIQSSDDLQTVRSQSEWPEQASQHSQHFMSTHSGLDVSFLHPSQWWLTIVDNDVCGWSHPVLKLLDKNHSCFHISGIDPACVYIIRESNDDLIHFYCYLDYCGKPRSPL